MDLPIDARRAPFKEKYLDEETPALTRWFDTGIDAKDRTFFVGTKDEDIFSGLTFDQANRIIRARERFVNAVLAIVNDRP